MVLGIDGVPFELLHSFAESGIMPQVKRCIDRYGMMRTQAPLPEISSVSWTSLMTGKNPGETGIFGFMELNPDTYAYTFPSFKHLPVRTIWEELGDAGKRSVIINLPSTYTARPMKGILVSGFVAPELERAVFPPSIFPMLKKMNYRVDADASRVQEDKTAFLNTLNDILDTRWLCYQKLERKENWDLCFFIITETDRLHHFFFDAVDNPQSPFYTAFIDFYKRLDIIIGEIVHRMEKEGIPFVILSDHGFGKIKKEIYISQYLKQWGYLKLLGENPVNLMGMTPGTRAFALDPSRIYIHREGTYKRGQVKKEEVEPLRNELKERFLDLSVETKEGKEHVIRRVFDKEEIYEGPYLDQAPDLVLLSNPGFDLKSGVTKQTLNDKTFFEGMHTQDNAVLIDSFGLKLNPHPFIYEIGKRINAYFNLC